MHFTRSKLVTGIICIFGSNHLTAMLRNFVAGNTVFLYVTCNNA